MVTVICVDGLAGNPRTTFSSLRQELEEHEVRVEMLPSLPVTCHSDRTSDVLRMVKRSQKWGPVHLVGQSAGGSAVFNAAPRIHNPNFKSIILLSPAMPRGINYMTKTLLWIMLRNLHNLFGKKPFSLGGLDLLSLLSPVPQELCNEITRDSVPISPKEARELAFLPPKLGRISVPCLHIYGAKDRWISPWAQVNLRNRLVQKSPKYVGMEIPDAGHATLYHPATSAFICSWIQSFEDSP